MGAASGRGTGGEAGRFRAFGGGELTDWGQKGQHLVVVPWGALGTEECRVILPSRQDWEGLLEGGPAPGEGRGETGRGSHQQHTFTEHLLCAGTVRS